MNFVRSGVIKWQQSLAGDTSEPPLNEFLRRYLSADALAPSAALWTDDALLIPVIENDGLVTSIFEAEDDAEEAARNSSSATEADTNPNAKRSESLAGTCTAAASVLTGPELAAAEIAALKAQLDAARSLIARLTTSSDGRASSSSGAGGACDDNDSEDDRSSGEGYDDSRLICGGGGSRHVARNGPSGEGARAAPPQQDNDTYYFNSECAWRTWVLCYCCRENAVRRTGLSNCAH